MSRHTRSSLFLLTAALLIPAVTLPMIPAATLSTAAAQEPASNPNEITVDACMVGYINKVEIPAEVQGKLNAVKVEEGMTVKKDDLIATIDDTQAKLAIDVKKAEEEEAILNATNDVNLRDAKNSEEIARAEAESYKDLHKEGATPFWEMRKKIMEAERAKLRIELAEQQAKIAKVQYFGKRADLRLAEEEVKRRQIKAPFDGFIERREAQLGQWVQPGSPIATLVQMDKLKVEGDIDALRYSGMVMKGAPVRVLVYHNQGEPIVIEAVLTYVSTEIDLNNRYRVWAEIPNTPKGDDWLIKPGMRAKIIIKSNVPAQNSFF